jgi:hypothetical protein
VRHAAHQSTHCNSNRCLNIVAIKRWREDERGAGLRTLAAFSTSLL